MFTHDALVILQLIHYNLCSKTSLQAFHQYKLPVLTSQLCVAWRVPPNLVSQPYLIFSHMWNIQHFLFFLTFIYNWEILYKPHCQQCWVTFNPCWSYFSAVNTFTSYVANHPYKLSNAIHCQFWHHSCIWLKELLAKFGVTSLSYL